VGDMQLMKDTITIIVPCYNEEKRLNLDAFSRYANQAKTIKFIFVNDGSNDNTEIVLSEFVREHYEEFSLLTLPFNQGKAEAVRYGFQNALKSSQSFIGYWDADLSTPLSAIQQFIEVFNQRPNCLLVMGSRVKLLGRIIERNKCRHYFGRIFATFAAVTLNREIYDTQCGAKLFRVFPRLQPIFDKPFISRWLFDVELIARLIKIEEIERDRTGDVIYEYPLHQWVHDGFSSVRFFDFIKAPYELAKIRKNIGKL
jgi:glycosyltransferase involved in cell wall biosynthesis